jgi:uncharacterized protein (DUF58 family)
MNLTAATSAPDEDAPLVDRAELKDIELVVLKRMREYATGAHGSVFQGKGLDLVGLRDWEPGDRPSDVDWAQSSITNFSPLVSREFEQESTATLMVVADTSLSTRCGANETPLAKVIARAMTTLGLAAAFFQDQAGLVTFDGTSRRLAVRPRVGRNQVIHCLETYQAAVYRRPERHPHAESNLVGILGRPSFVPVVSDFLFDTAPDLFDELAYVAATHDVLIVMVDAAFAYDFPAMSSGWIETYDVETGHRRTVSARELEGLGREVRKWQDRTAMAARHAGLEVVRLEPGHEHRMLSDCLAERRLRKR